MRRSGLAHLLSVSGLHIAAVVGAAMLLTLKLLALSERLALRFNLVLAAAGVGALAGVAYTLLTGAQVPTVRSCIAALLVLGGLALGRDAISLRLVAVGALIVLLFRPEALAGPSFQFSFAAVTAIIALHSSAWGRRLLARRDEGPIAGAGRTLLGMILTGLAVEIALMPFALYHFHKAGLFGVAANLVGIPADDLRHHAAGGGGLVPRPRRSGQAVLVGGGAGARRPASGLPMQWRAPAGRSTTLPSMPGWAFGLMVLGSLWLCIWTSRLRLLGFVPFAIGAFGASMSPVPDLLVTGDGRHLALVSSEGMPMMLRERTGDFMRDLMSEASGFDEEPGLLEAAPGQLLLARRLLRHHAAGRPRISSARDADLDPN